MSIAYPRAFLTEGNFALAFRRIVQSDNPDYKQFYSHVFQSYNIGTNEYTKELISSIAKGTYQPAPSELVFKPKPSGILRPVTLLSFRDLVVYQAIVNVIADRMKGEQGQYAHKKCFGAIYAGAGSDFFFQSWKKGHRRFTDEIAGAFKKGNVYVADFDIVSCYELIDHNLLCECIVKRVKNKELLELLRKCLAGWTTDPKDSRLRHGLPQGPEASAFLAECVLFRFDAMKFMDVVYVRYIDDIKLMAKEETPLRRALLHLDLMSKSLGLVPQAQKINLGKVNTVEDITKTIPSAVLSQVRGGSKPQQTLYRLFCGSIKKEKGRDEIIDVTAFKFSILRLNPRRDVLKRIAPLLIRRPDCSYWFAAYLKKFPASPEAANILLETLRRDPTYDAAAAHYIEAMDECEPRRLYTAYRRIVSTAKKRSIEKSILVRLAVLTFKARRAGPKHAAYMINDEPNYMVKNIVLHRLFGEDDDTPYKVADCVGLLELGVSSPDEDFARCCALRLIYHAADVGGSWEPPPSAHPAVKTLMVGLGLRKQGPRRPSVLEGFFANIGFKGKMPWRKALGNDLSDAERRCLRLQELRLGDPTAMVLMLDTFNEVLIQAFSRLHPALASAYSSAAGSRPHPDLGNWLNNWMTNQSIMNPVSSATVKWFLDVHNTRVKGDLAHAKSKRGKRTKSISFKRADKLFTGGFRAWRELLTVWEKLL